MRGVSIALLIAVVGLCAAVYSRKPARSVPQVDPSERDWPPAHYLYFGGYDTAIDAVTVDDRFVYWEQGGKLFSADKRGGAAPRLLRKCADCQTNELVSDGSHLYVLTPANLVRIERTSGRETGWPLAWDAVKRGALLVDSTHAYVAMPGCAAIVRYDKQTGAREEMYLEGVGVPKHAGRTALSFAGPRLVCASPSNVYVIDRWKSAGRSLVADIPGLFGLAVVRDEAFWLEFGPESLLPALGSVPFAGGPPSRFAPAPAATEAGYTSRLVYSDVLGRLLYGTKNGIRGLNPATKQLDVFAECCQVSTDLAVDSKFVYVGVDGWRMGAKAGEPRRRASWLARVPLSELAAPRVPVPLASANPNLAPPACPTPEPFMARISKGTFTMGRLHGRDAPTRVTLKSEFELDRMEVTVRAYQACMDEGACSRPRGRGCNVDRPEFACHAVNCVDREQAQKYCHWAGKTLPSAEEWEFAARGSAGREYPWGANPPDDALSCWSGSKRRATACIVGSFPSGASPFGVLDLAGSVREWTRSPYCEAYPGGACRGNDCATATCTSTLGTLRGGGWLDDTPIELSSTFRVASDPKTGLVDAGFRCARPVP